MTAAVEKATETPAEAGLLSVDQLFTGKDLPYREVDIPERGGKMLVQGLRASVFDEINDVEQQRRRVQAGEGGTMASGVTYHWAALVMAYGLRTPDKKPACRNHYPAFAERLLNELSPSTLLSGSGAISELSGFGKGAREEQKKDS